jgi:TolA-binding protein
LPPGGNDKLLNLAAAFRANGDSLEPLLPWLLLLQKRGGADVRVELCLFEAWGTDALDCNASKAAAERLKKLDEVPLSKFLFEAKAFPAGKTDTVKRLVDQLCAGKLDKGAPLGAFALARALVAGFEKDYELAMQLGDFGRAQKCLETMLLANPKDLAAQLMLEVCGGQVKGARFVDRYKEASPAERDAIDARLQHLGLGIVAPGVSVAAVAQAASDDALDFFRTDLAKRVKELDSPIKAAEQAHKKKTDKAQNLREEIVELERKIKKFERIVGMRREVRGWKEDIDERKAEIEKCEAEAKNEIDVKTRLEAQRNELQGKIDAVNRRRSEFKLQPTADDPMPRDPDPEPRAAAGQPREADPFQPPDAPRQPAAVAPPMVEFDEALPQAKELRAATADLELGRFEKARNAFRAVMKDAVARVPADVTTQRLIAVTRYRLAESLQKLGMQKALVTRNDIDAQVDLNEADREFARLTGDDFGTAREGSSLRAAALRMRLQINSTLYRAYRGLAEANSRDASHRTRRDAHAKTANQMLEQLKSSFATATLPDGRRIVDVARDEAAAAALAR